ncbi:MAG: alpha/beta fold hydrolase [Burkholderiales bacterium]
MDQIAFHTASFFTDDGVRLNILSAAPSDSAASIRTPVLFIPGWCMPAEIWRDTLLALASRYPVFALDLRGQGNSEVPDTGYHIDRRADDIAQCIERIGNVVIVAWSLGALEALHYVHRYSEAKLRGLVIVDSSVGEDPPIAQASQFREALNRNRIAALEQFIRAMFARPQPPAWLADLTVRATQIPLEASLALFPSHLPREHWRGITRGLRAPLLYAITRQFANQAQNLREARPSTQIELFEEAGHALFIDEPKRFISSLNSFLHKLPAKA